MFSYRHAYHAGNHADVLKHTVLIAILKHLCAKDTDLCAIDTHAGAGLYRLDGAPAQTSGESLEGLLALVGRLVRRQPLGAKGGGMASNTPTAWLARSLSVVGLRSPSRSLSVLPPTTSVTQGAPARRPGSCAEAEALDEPPHIVHPVPRRGGRVATAG